MTASRLTRYFGYAGAIAALGLALTLTCAPVSALAADDDDDSSIWNLDKRIFKGVMRGLGLKGANDEEIEYRERSPLVVPPTRDLPPPQTSTGLPAPNWPAEPVSPQRTFSILPGNYTDTDTASRPLTPSQLNKGRAAARQTDQGRTVDQEGKALRPSQLGFTGFKSIFSGGSNTNEVGTFTAEPPRTALTEPPPGYQTPSPAAPYGVTKRIEYGPARKAEDIPIGAPTR